MPRVKTIRPLTNWAQLNSPSTFYGYNLGISVAEGIARDGIQLYILCTFEYSELRQHFLSLEHLVVCRLKENIKTAASLPQIF